jgi:hypothetical protein
MCDGVPHTHRDVGLPDTKGNHRLD